MAIRPDRPRRTALDGRDGGRRGPARQDPRRPTGIPLGSAHRLAPEATFLDLAPEADRDTVEAACERLAAFSPGIAGTSDVTQPAFGRIAVHVDGLTRLWGIEETLVARMGEALAPVLPGPLQAGVAGTSFAAFVAAAHAPAGGTPILVPPGDDARFLASYPARLLTRDQDIRARLARFGLRTIGSVADLPASAVVAGFGDEGARLHARARGEETERFRPRRTPERLALALPLDPPAEGLDAVRFVLRRLAATLADQLQARGQAAGLARLIVTHDLAFARRGVPPGLHLEQRLPEPTADAEAIERLLFARLEKAPPPAAVARLELELARVEAATGQQDCRCSRRRPRATPDWPGSSRGWRSRSAPTGCGGSRSPIPRRRSPRRAGVGCPSRAPR